MLKVVQLDVATKGPRITQTSGLVVCDQHGNPLLTVIEHQPGVQTITTMDDPNFKQQLLMLGLGSLYVEGITQKQIKSPPVPSNYQLLGANS